MNDCPLQRDEYHSNAPRGTPMTPPADLAEVLPGGMENADSTALQAAHDMLIDRLHRRSDDFDATRELRAVIAAIQRLPPRKGTIRAAQ